MGLRTSGAMSARETRQDVIVEDVRPRVSVRSAHASRTAHPRDPIQSLSRLRTAYGPHAMWEFHWQARRQRLDHDRLEIYD